MFPVTPRSQRLLSLHDLVRKQSHPRLAFKDAAALEFNPLLPVMIMKKASLVTSPPRQAKTGGAILSDLARRLRGATGRSAQERVRPRFYYRVYCCSAGATAGLTISSVYPPFGPAVLDPLTRAYSLLLTRTHASKGEPG
jgi:hypothetical protein